MLKPVGVDVQMAVGGSAGAGLVAPAKDEEEVMFDSFGEPAVTVTPTATFSIYVLFKRHP